MRTFLSVVCFLALACGSEPAHDGRTDGGSPDAAGPDAGSRDASESERDQDAPVSERCVAAADLRATRGDTPALLWSAVPFSDAFFGPAPFQAVQYVPGEGDGHFIVSGDCSFGSSGIRHESAGMYLFDAVGAHLATRDVCLDSRPPIGGCGEAGGCTVIHDVHPLGAGRFVRELQSDLIDASRSPILYRVNGNDIALDGQVFFGEQPEGIPYAAPAGGLLWGSTGPFGAADDVIGYDLADLTRRVTALPATNRPVWGVGELLLTLADRDIEVRRASASDAPVVQTLSAPDGFSFFGVTTDPFDERTIAVRWRGATIRVERWTLDGGGLSFVDRQEFGRSSVSVSVAGDYVAFARCDGRGPDRSCELVIRRSGVDVPMDPLPAAADGEPLRIEAIALGPNTVLFAGDSLGTNGEVWAYRLDDPNPRCRAAD